MYTGQLEAADETKMKIQDQGISARYLDSTHVGSSEFFREMHSALKYYEYSPCPKKF